MVPVLDRHLLENAHRHPVNWRGRSGRFYALDAERIESFAFAGDATYLLALGPMPLWAGSAADVVADPDSRARLRLALDCADRVYRVPVTADPVARMTIVWDLEGAEPVSGLTATAA